MVNHRKKRVKKTKEPKQKLEEKKLKEITKDMNVEMEEEEPNNEIFEERVEEQNEMNIMQKNRTKNQKLMKIKQIIWKHMKNTKLMMMYHVKCLKKTRTRTHTKKKSKLTQKLTK